MQGVLYEESSAWLFLLVTCVLGGGAAWMTGRAYAITWRSIPALVLALLLLGSPPASSITRCSAARCFRRNTMSSTRSC